MVYKPRSQWPDYGSEEWRYAVDCHRTGKDVEIGVSFSTLGAAICHPIICHRGTHSLPDFRRYEKVTDGTPGHRQECGATESSDEAEDDEDAW